MLKILLFDDQLYARRAELGVPGMDLRCFLNADDAELLVERERPDVVLMDFHMAAVRTGAEAIDALRARWPRGRLAIIAISQDDAGNEALLRAGADEAIRKTGLRARLEELVAVGGYQPPDR